MQTISNALAIHLGQEVTTLATCWSIRRKDGVSFYFTSHDRDILIEGNLYKAADAMTPSAVSSQSGLTVDNMDFEGILNPAGLTQEDVMSGRYDHAEIVIFMVNYLAPEAGKLHLKTGWLGEVTLRGTQFVAELRGISARLQQTIGEVYTRSCRAALGDARCGIDLDLFTLNGVVSAVETNFSFVDSNKTQSNGYFSGGLITFTTGLNAGLSMEVRDFSASGFTLFLPLPHAIQVGDAYKVSAGCDKQFDTCIRKFNNAINYRGEPHVPGTDKLLETSATRSR